MRICWHDLKSHQSDSIAECGWNYVGSVGWIGAYLQQLWKLVMWVEPCGIHRMYWGPFTVAADESIVFGHFSAFFIMRCEAFIK